MYVITQYLNKAILFSILLLFIFIISKNTVYSQNIIESFPTDPTNDSVNQNIFIKLSSYNLDLNYQNNLKNIVAVETNIDNLNSIKVESSDFLEVKVLDSLENPLKFQVTVKDEYKNEPISANGKVSFKYEDSSTNNNEINSELIVTIDNFSNLLKSNNIETNNELNFCSNNLSRLSLNTLGGWDSNGVPDYLSEKIDVTNSLVKKSKELLPEKKPVPINNPEFISGPDKTELKIIKSGNVSLTFVDEGAGFKNTIGFYTYPIGQRPKKINEISNMTVVFPNSSKQSSGGDLKAGMTVNLGKFSAGTAIGWFLIPDAWNSNSNEINNCIQPYFSDPDLNPEIDPALRYHNVQVFIEESNKVLLGFEDLLRDSKTRKSDDDFNDVTFLVNLEVEDQIEETDLIIENDNDKYECSETDLWFGTQSSIEKDLETENMILPNTIAIEIHPLNLDMYTLTTDNKIIKFNKKQLVESNFLDSGEEIFSIDESLNITSIKLIDDELLLESNKSSGLYTISLDKPDLGLKPKLDNLKDFTDFGKYTYNLMDNNYYRIVGKSLIRGDLEICNNLGINGNIKNTDITQDGYISIITEAENGRIFYKYNINYNTCAIDSETEIISTITSLSTVHNEQCNPITALSNNDVGQEEDIDDIYETDNNFIEQIYERDAEQQLNENDKKFSVTTNIDKKNGLELYSCNTPSLKNIIFNSINGYKISRIDYRADLNSNWSNINLTQGLGSYNIRIDELQLDNKTTINKIQFRLLSNQNEEFLTPLYPIKYIDNCEGEVKVLNYEFDNGYGDAILTENREIELNPNLKSSFRVEVEGNLSNLFIQFENESEEYYSYPLEYKVNSELWEIDLDPEIYQNNSYDLSLFVKDNLDNKKKLKVLPKVTIAFAGETENTKTKPTYWDKSYSGALKYEIYKKINNTWEIYDYNQIFANSSYNLTLPNNIFKLPAGEYYIKAIKTSDDRNRSITSDFFTLETESNVKFDTEALDKSYVERLFTKVKVRINNNDKSNVLALYDENDQKISREDLIKSSLKKAELDNSVNDVYVYYWTRWDKNSSERLSELIDIYKKDKNVVIITDSQNYEQLVRQLKVNYGNKFMNSQNFNWVISEDDFDFHYYNALPNNELIIYKRSTQKITYL